MIDAHFHCWQLARADYGWLTPELAPIYRDVSVADWQRQAQACQGFQNDGHHGEAEGVAD